MRKLARLTVVLGACTWPGMAAAAPDTTPLTATVTNLPLTMSLNPVHALTATSAAGRWAEGLTP